MNRMYAILLLHPQKREKHDNLPAIILKAEASPTQ